MSNGVTVHLAKGNERGQWQLVKTKHGWSALLKCPGCGELQSLLDHQITADGVVQPSVQCGNERCGFHEYVVLTGYRGEA